MPDLTIECRPWCKTNEYWEKQVKGGTGETYTVVWGQTPTGETVYGWTCTCKSFKYGTSRTCKHIKAVESERCAWNQEAAYGSGEAETPSNHKCPKCGGELSGIRIAV